MTLKSFAAVAALVMLASAVGGARSAAQMSDDERGHRFNNAVAAYQAIRQSVEWRIPIHGCIDPEELLSGSNALADAIRSARPDAQQGDIFTADVSPLFRERIRSALTSRPATTSDLLADIAREAPASPLDLPVNGRFDWRYGAAMPPTIIQVLPPLPDSLQYRLVRSSLVLIDIDANLIVDVLPHALAID